MTTYSGGCQCGAVRFRVTGTLKDTSICHCRMCQKAFGSYYAPLVSTRGADLEWTRGAPKRFQSSSVVQRGFCENCGTPLTYEAPDGIAVAAGAFDNPEALPPRMQYGIEGKMSFFNTLHAIPGYETLDDLGNAPFLTSIVSFQHPDRDTEEWPQQRTSGDDQTAGA